MKVFVRKCDCDSKKCSYCKNHNRYLREKDAFMRRSHARRLRVKESEDFVRGVLSDFQCGVIGLGELYIGLDIGGDEFVREEEKQV